MTKPTNTFKNANLRPNKLALALAAAGLMFSVSGSVVAAEKARLSAKEKEIQKEEVEKIQVTGVRGALETALNTKREALSIVDAISASDIDALPALDLGEALQAVPGVQLERSGEGRQSEISLRGLGGGFVKTTAFGQGFATPSNSESLVGSTNPFSSFESGVFDGITVVKAPTADMQAGGIAGIVDKKLQRALSKPSGKYQISIGSRYEELTENWDPSVKLQGSHHLIQDKLAVAFKVAASGQTFRRDTANFTTYAPLGVNPHASVDRSNSDTIDAYRDKWDIPADAEVRGVALARNVTEFSDGDRLSFSGNIEWKASDKLKLGTHLLYTKRDLDKGTKQDASFSAGYNEGKPQNSDRFYMIEPDMDSEPFLYDTKEDGSPVYGVTKTSISDGAYQFTNRETTFLETSKGIMLYADYLGDDWKIDGVITRSASENQFMNIGLDTRLTGHHKASTKVNGVNYVTQPTNIDVEIDAAYGNINDASVSATGWENITWDTDWVSSTNLSHSSITTVDDKNDGRRLGFYVTGRVKNPTRDVSSAEINAERYLDFGIGDAIRFDSFKFGARASVEELENRDQQLTIAGINVEGAGDDAVNTTDLVSNGQASFFNGEYPGTFGADSGWRTFNNEELQAHLTNPLAELPNGRVAEPSGFYERFVGAHPQRYATNFKAESTIAAAYLMTKFYGELGSIPYTGNIGVRHVTTDNEFNGFKRDRNSPEGDVLLPVTVDQDYSHTLPSANLSFELHDDVVLRTAYSEGLVRPNLLSQTPTTDVSGSGQKVTITKPSALVNPYDAKNYDLSLEWYNRDGSAISVGVFQKEITGFFYTDKTCPEGDQVIIDALNSDIKRTDNPETGGFTCEQIAPFTNDNGDVETREVVVKEKLNSDGEIKLTGVEVAIQQKLDFLPYPWNGFGGVFNYTYIDQETTGVADNDDNAKLYKVSPESYNLIGYYENDGFSMRLSYNWRDDSLLKGSNSFLGTLPRVQQAYGRLDAVASYKLTNKLRVYLRGYNLNDAKRVESWGFDDRAVNRVDYTGKIFEISMNYTF